MWASTGGFITHGLDNDLTLDKDNIYVSCHWDLKRELVSLS